MKAYLCSWFDSQEDDTSVINTSQSNAINQRSSSTSSSSSSSSSSSNISSAASGACIPCCLIGTSNRLEDIDKELRRGGRFETEIDVIGQRGDRERLVKNLLKLTINKTNANSAVAASVSVSDETIDKVAGIVADKTGYLSSYSMHCMFIIFYICICK